MDTIKNKRKVTGAFVWHRSRIRLITSQKLQDQNCVLLDNLYKVKKKSVRLVKIGDPISFRMDAVGLPSRCKPGRRKVSHMRDNGLIGTDKDLHEYDDAAYQYFEKYKTLKFDTPNN